MTHAPKAALPLLLIALYALSILLANLTLNTFIPLPVYGLLSVGTIFFAAVFTLRDRIHRAGGLNAVYIAIAWSRNDTKVARRLDRQADRTDDAELEAYNEMLQKMSRSPGRTSRSG